MTTTIGPLEGWVCFYTEKPDHYVSARETLTTLEVDMSFHLLRLNVLLPLATLNGYDDVTAFT